MLRSVALTFSIIANRAWLMILFAVFIPEIFTGGEVDPMALDQAIGVSSWMSWVVNLIIVECWLHRRPPIRIGSGHRQQHHRADGQRRTEALDRPNPLVQHQLGERDGAERGHRGRQPDQGQVTAPDRDQEEHV